MQTIAEEIKYILLFIMCKLFYVVDI